MHYFEDPQKRERHVTRDIVHTYLSPIAMALELTGEGIPLLEVQKSVYGAKGDVDLLIYYEPGKESESLIACEIKTSYLKSNGELKSAKANKRRTKTQLDNLRKDGFDYVWLLEFIVTEPAHGWFHPQAGEGLLIDTVTVEDAEFGHAKFQISAVSGRPEAEAGGISSRLVQKASRLPRSHKRENIIQAICVLIKGS